MKALVGHREGSDNKNQNKYQSFASKNIAIQNRVGAQKSAERRRLFPNENNVYETQSKHLPRYMQPVRREPRKSVVAQSIDSDAYSTAIKHVTRDFSPNTAMILSGRHRKDVSPREAARESNRPSQGVTRQKSYSEINTKYSKPWNRNTYPYQNPMSPVFKEMKMNEEKSRKNSGTPSRSSIGISTPIANIYNLKEPSASKMPEESILRSRKPYNRGHRRNMGSSKGSNVPSVSNSMRLQASGRGTWNQEDQSRSQRSEASNQVNSYTVPTSRKISPLDSRSQVQEANSVLNLNIGNKFTPKESQGIVFYPRYQTTEMS